MADFNQVLTPGDYENGLITMVVEIPAGSNLKIEWDRNVGVMRLDRIEPRIMPKPTNYGFIPRTLDEDGDELDVLLITDDPIPTGVVVEARILGVMKFIDDGEVDDKIVAVPADDRHTGDAHQTLEDVSPQLIRQLEHHFSHYKDLKSPGSTVVQEFSGTDEAKIVIRASIERWDNQ